MRAGSVMCARIPVRQGPSNMTQQPAASTDHCCPYCGSTNLVRRKRRAIDGQVRWECGECGRRLGLERSRTLKVICLAVCFIVLLACTSLMLSPMFWTMIRETWQGGKAGEAICAVAFLFLGVFLGLEGLYMVGA